MGFIRKKPITNTVILPESHPFPNIKDTTTIKKVADEFHLSAYEQHYLLTCDRGEALIIADQNHVAVKIVASEQEHPLLTTDPREVYI